MSGLEPLIILGAIALLNSNNMKGSANATQIMQAAIDSGTTIEFAKLLAAQAIHETGNFTSNVFKRNNNAFGMKVPRVRKSPWIVGAGTAAPISEGPTPYARYRNVAESAKDVLHWLAYNKVQPNLISTPEQYASILKQKGYYGNPVTEYIAGLKNGLKKLA